MNRLTRRIFSALACLSGVLPGLAAEATNAAPYRVTPPPAWVKVVAADMPDPPPKPEANEGQAFLLLDLQINAESEESYTRVTKLILDETGVQEGSRFSVSFDPAHQTLALHHIGLIRGNDRLDRLDPAKIKIIQQESDLERHVYNGSLTALLMLEDVRVGDQVDYAFTVRGRNPIFNGRFIDSSLAQWHVPLHTFRLRTLWSPARPVQLRLHGGAQKPVKTDWNGLVEHTWTARDLPALEEEDRLPSWYEPAPWIQFSEYADWASVAAWAAAMYTIPETLSPAMAALVDRWKNEPDEEKRLLAALQFVQDEVRYLGLEFGPFTHQPTAPDIVLARRFGDCKDKALLLCALLKALDIPACPALVNTEDLQAVADWLPSPYAFDHVIVRARLQSGPAWVDPTSSYQRGPLSARFLPAYGKALPIEPAASGLVPIKETHAGWPATELTERFTVRNYDDPVDLVAETLSRGADADEMREMLAGSSRDKLGKHWMNYYASSYPTIESAGPLLVEDDAQRNIIRTVERYRIRDFWVLSDDGKKWVASVYPGSISEWIRKPATTLRKMPLGLPHPVYRSQVIELTLPESWTVEKEDKVIESDYAKFTYRADYTGLTIRLFHLFETKTDHIPPGKVPEHVKLIDRIHDQMGYEVSRQDGETDPLKGPFDRITIVLAGLFILLVAGFWIGLYAFLKSWSRRPARTPPPLPGETPSGTER
jgi:hypothetical protein